MKMILRPFRKSRQNELGFDAWELPAIIWRDDCKWLSRHVNVKHGAATEFWTTIDICNTFILVRFTNPLIVADYKKWAMAMNESIQFSFAKYDAQRKRHMTLLYDKDVVQT